MSVVEELAEHDGLDARQVRAVLSEVRDGSIPRSARVVKRGRGRWLEWRRGSVVSRVALDPEAQPIRTSPVVGTAHVVDSLAGLTRPRAASSTTFGFRRGSQTTAPSAGAIRRVVLTSTAYKELTGEGSHLHEREMTGALYGFVDRDEVWIRSAPVATEEGSSARTSVRLDMRQVLEQEARVWHLGCRWIGDWHSHPSRIGDVADPSTADLRGWRKALEAAGTPAYVGIIAQRGGQGEAAWNHPRLTAVVLRRSDGQLDADVLNVSVEQPDGRIHTPTHGTDSTIPNETPWRL